MPAKKRKAATRKKPANERDVRAYVEWPPGGRWQPKDLKKLPNGFITGDDLDLRIRKRWKPGSFPIEVFFQASEEEFLETRSPHAALKTFLDAYDSQIYPSYEVLNFLAESFRKYFDGDGKLSLDEALGTSNKGKGRGNTRTYFQKRRESKRDRFLCWNMCILRTFWPKLKVVEAAELVSKRSEREPSWNGPAKKLSSSEIEDRWNRFPLWKEIRQTFFPTGFFFKKYKAMSTEERRVYLQRYPLEPLDLIHNGALKSELLRLYQVSE